MKISIIYINQASADEILSDLKNAPNTFYVEIDGRKCKVSLDYLTEMSVKFQFPIPSKGYDGYLDWIRDLTWIEEENIVIVINYFKDFLCDDQRDKQFVLESFREIVFPWWESEVCEHMVEGKPRSFMVYVVE